MRQNGDAEMFSYSDLPTFQGESLTLFRYDALEYRDRTFYEVHSIPEGTDSIAMSNLQEDAERGYLAWLPLSSGSDYSGDTVTRANYEYFLGEYLEVCIPVYGMFGTYGIVVPVWHFPETLQEDLEDLEDYPVISDDALSNLEMRLEEEAWESWVRGDFSSALEDAGIDTEGIPEGALRETFHAALEASNTYAEHEPGCSVYYDIDRIIGDAASILQEGQ